MNLRESRARLVWTIGISALLLLTVGLWIGRAFSDDPGEVQGFIARRSVSPLSTSTPTATHRALAATPAQAQHDHRVYLPAVRGAQVQVAEVPPAVTDTPTPTATIPPSPTPSPTPSPAPTPTPKPLQLRSDLPPLRLRDWPRPAGDNGRGMHFLPVAYYEDVDLDLQIGRLKELGVKWALVIYGDEIQLRKLAPRFRDAGIMVVWRKGLRANERYYGWQRDVEILREFGMPPYMQLYNEPSLSAEWKEGGPKWERFEDHILQAMRDVYNAGGYVGLQFVNAEWLRRTLRAVKARQGQAIFGRMFFIPHPYGLNHPPDYVEDPNGVLGFRYFAQIFQEEIGFIPPMIAGEGGWKFNASDDNRFPRIDDALHRDYHVEVFNWFRTGKLSDGSELPDYLFAFCPWLLSSKLDDSAWYDSFAGPRTATIEAVKRIPPFVRRFSWDQ